MLLLAVPRFGQPVLPMDEGMTVVYGDLVARGYVSHRDFQTLYGPGMPWLIAAAFKLFGSSITVERAMAALTQLALVVGAAAFARRWGVRTATAGGLVCAAIVTRVDPFAYSPVVAAAASVWSVTILTRSKAQRAGIAAGLLAAIALTFRPDYAPAALVPAAVTLWRASRGTRLSYVGGLVAGLIPLAVHIIVATPAAFFGDLVVDALRAVPSRRLPLPPAEPHVALLFFTTLLFVVWAFWPATRSRRDGVGGGADDTLPPYAVLALLLVPQAAQRADQTHVAVLAAVTAPLIAVAIARWARRIRWTTSRVAAALITFAVLWAALALPALRPASVSAVAVSRGSRSYPDYPLYARDLQAVAVAVDDHARPGARLFIGPTPLTRTNYNDTIMYYLFPDLVPATYYLEMEPQTANRPGSRLASDIASADLLILTTRWNDWNEPNDSRLAGSAESDRVVAELFRVVEQHGAYALYVRR